MICRLCTIKCEVESVVDLFKEVEGNLVDVIEKHLQIKVHKHDDYSTLICQNCCSHLTDFNNFFQMIQKKQQILMDSKKLTDIFYTNEFENINEQFEMEEHEKFAGEKEEFVKCYNTSETAIFSSIKYETLEEDFVEPEVQKLVTELKNDNKADTEKLNAVAEVRNEAPHSLSKEEESFEKLLEKQKKVQKRKRSKKNPAEYRKGEELIAKNIELRCNKCNIHFESFNELKVHYRQAHEGLEGYVSCCNRNIYSRNELLDHIKSHTDPEIFKCKLCEKQFLSRKYMQIHVTNAHLNGVGSKYTCKFCNKGFAWISALRKHLDCHKSERSHICVECGASFHGYSRLQAHINRVHKTTIEDSNFQCELCGRHYKSKRSLLRHLKNHTATKKLFGNKAQCNICLKWFKTEQSCKSHIIGEHATEGAIVHFE